MPDQRVAVRGDLSLVSMASVLQLIEAESITGSLEVEAGAVQFVAGRPVSAAVAGFDGIDGLLEAFVQDGDRFTVTACAVEAAPPLGDLLGLMLEGCRLADEWRRLAWLVLRVAHRDDVARLGPAAVALVEQLDGRTAVELAVRRASLPRSRAIDPLLTLLDAGVVHEVTSAPPPRRERATEAAGDFAEVMERGRAALRAGEFTRAEAHFERATQLRPDDRIAAQNLRRVQALRERGGAPTGFATWARRS